LNAKVKLAAHNCGMRFSCKFIEEIYAHAVDLVVDIEAENILVGRLARSSENIYHLMYLR